MATYTIVHISAVHHMHDEYHKNIQIVINTISQHDYIFMENIQGLQWFVI
jgi:hypothetical protein